jgi:predicted nuclease with TOPRIM domain
MAMLSKIDNRVETRILKTTIAKISEDLTKKMEGYTHSLLDHRREEERLLKELEKNRKKQDAVKDLIADISKESDVLESFIEWRKEQ